MSDEVEGTGRLRRFGRLDRERPRHQRHDCPYGCVLGTRASTRLSIPFSPNTAWVESVSLT